MIRETLYRALFLAFLLGFPGSSVADLSATKLRGMRAKAVEELTGKSSEPRFFFLAIAIGRYQHRGWQDLETPVRDAAAVRDVLKERYLFSPDNILEVYDEQATVRNIMRAFAEIRERAGPQDSVLIYYAGHGVTDEAGTGYWIPHDGGPVGEDYTWISHDKVKNQLRRMKDVKHVLLICDSCYAGQFFRGNILDKQHRLQGDLHVAYSQSSRYALTSGGNEPVKDASIDNEHSIFAHFLLRALRENDRQFITPADRLLFGYIQSGLAANSLGSTQTPQYGVILDAGGTTDGQFVFFLREGQWKHRWKTVAGSQKEPAKPPQEKSDSSASPKHVTSAMDQQTSKQWALVIGISEYRDPSVPVIRYASADARAFYGWLTSPQGANFDESRVKLLCDEQATAANIRDALFNWLKQPIAEDVVTIYYAGHGSPDSPDDIRNLFLLPYDVDYSRISSTAFPMWDIETSIRRFIKAERIVIIADACHSAGIGRQFDIARRAGRGMKANPIGKGFGDLSAAGDSVCVLTAAEDAQYSQEGEQWGGGHGVFTYFLLRGLEGNADGNRDGRVMIGELALYISEQVRRATVNAQCPRISGNFDPMLTIGGR